MILGFAISTLYPHFLIILMLKPILNKTSFIDACICCIPTFAVFTSVVFTIISLGSLPYQFSDNRIVLRRIKLFPSQHNFIIINVVRFMSKKLIASGCRLQAKGQQYTQAHDRCFIGALTFWQTLFSKNYAIFHLQTGNYTE